MIEERRSAEPEAGIILRITLEPFFLRIISSGPGVVEELFGGAEPGGLLLSESVRWARFFFTGVEGRERDAGGG